MGLCAPTANDIVRIHIASWTICADSFCRVGTFHSQPVDPCTLREQRHYRYPIRRYAFLSVSAQFFGEISQPASVSCRTSSSVKIVPALTFIHFFDQCVSSLLERLAHRTCRMGSEDFCHRLSSSTLSSCCFFRVPCHSHLKESIPLVFAMSLLE